ncbi:MULTISPECIES: esterase-like activity of phytase family protein [unclassified Leptolyngbya]|uniref:esterase-like activity of phytase family protein n=1 Tax=unclassified Leptolyngbya TaxID=2650499 RepID=UPI001685C161|nr:MULTISPECIES: esterase-like activity of phytase family protein [unclassified Leptolyngbya]MBD1913739.1 esterase-like activity of phytase family protein [Leptolyngbya sp. FACHB-8]MBD2153225.1 esterase-like activity of phytase family protein [Leptolyngbya sp. FACHB-16]
MNVLPIVKRPWWGRAIALLALFLTLTGCTLPRVSAEERLFLPLAVELLDTYEIPKSSFEGVPVGGLSAIAYERVSDRFLVLSDDRSSEAPARFYTMAMELDRTEPAHPTISGITVERATPLHNQDGTTFAAGSIDPEGLALSPRQTVFISSEGDTSQGIPPFIQEFDRETGEWRSSLPLPQRYLPKLDEEAPSGVRNNLGFEALALDPGGTTISNGYGEPFRIFAAVEGALAQDQPTVPEAPEPLRLLHYLVSENVPALLAEHLYYLEPTPAGVLYNGLTELLVLGQGGHFLSLERTFGANGAGAKLFQLAVANATDTSSIRVFEGDLSLIQPIHKQLLLDLNTLGFPLDNLEAMTLGPRLPDGSQSLILLSDDNFSDRQTNQVLLFRITGL